MTAFKKKFNVRPPNSKKFEKKFESFFLQAAQLWSGHLESAAEAGAWHSGGDFAKHMQKHLKICTMQNHVKSSVKSFENMHHA